MMLTTLIYIIYYVQKIINAKKSLNMMEEMMDPNIIDYYIINTQSKMVAKSILASLVPRFYT